MSVIAALPPRPVSLRGPESWVTDDITALLVEAAAVQGRAQPAIVLARKAGLLAPMPGSGQTFVRWELLASLSAADLAAGRVAEAHLDALAILAEHGPVDLAPIDADSASTWGVFAAEGRGIRVIAEPDGHGWQLTGEKPWCSLAGQLSHALVTAYVDGGRRLFAVALRSDRVDVLDQPWVSRGLSDVISGPVRFDRAPAVPVGEIDWYLHRPGFAWGGIGVAACWYGGAVGVARRVQQRLRSGEPDQIGRAQLGAIDACLYRSRGALAMGAADVDAGRALGEDAVRLAGRVRAVVAEAAEEVLLRSGHVLGPGPLAQDEDHARRVADLQIYLRQHHAERDQAALGQLLMDELPPW